MPDPGVDELDPSTEFRQLYEREYTSVYRSIYSMVLDSAEAEDLAQETFVRAYKARERYKPTGPPGAWLHRIAVNVAISHLRRRKLSRLLPVRIFTPPDTGEYDRSDAKSVVEKALASLTPKLRAAVALHYYQGYTRDEIAQVLRIPSGTVASRMAKAMSIMRGTLDMSDQVAAAGRSRGEGVHS